MKKMIVCVQAVSMCLLVFGALGGCRKEVPGDKTGQAAEVEKKDAVDMEVEVVSGDAGDKINLRILYAGLLDTDRQKDFVKFLSGHFKEVGIADFLNFKPTQTEDFDVVILDHDGAEFRAPRPDVSRDYSRATITMGVPGAFISNNLGLKTAYL